MFLGLVCLLREHKFELSDDLDLEQNDLDFLLDDDDDDDDDEEEEEEEEEDLLRFRRLPEDSLEL